VFLYFVLFFFEKKKKKEIDYLYSHNRGRLSY